METFTITQELITQIFVFLNKNFDECSFSFLSRLRSKKRDIGAAFPVTAAATSTSKT